MKNYVQLKDGIVFAAHQSQFDVDDSGPNVWLVEEDASDKLGKTYNTNNGTFSNATEIKYAVLDSNNTVVQILSTVFSSEVDGPIITDDAVKVLSTWDGENFVPNANVAAASITVLEPEPEIVLPPDTAANMVGPK
jgi:hypothetical protein